MPAVGSGEEAASGKCRLPQLYARTGKRGGGECRLWDLDPARAEARAIRAIAPDLGG
ncbi:MAG: hypothetical protein ACR2OB_10355 [Solirubrobacteraceae bacterium]